MRPVMTVGAAVVAALLVQSACSTERMQDLANSPPVAAVAIAPPIADMQVGQTVQLTATTRDASGNVLTERAIAWSSLNTAIAGVSNTGLVSGIAAGQTTVEATSEGMKQSATVNVVAAPPPPPPAVASVSVAPPSAGVQVGQTVQLAATVRDAGGNALTGRVVTWVSANSSWATVSASGLVTGVAPGGVTITATSEGVSGSSVITVSSAPPPPPPPVATVTVTPNPSSVQAGQTVQLAATLRDAGGNVLTGRTIAWSSVSTGTATVSATGLVTGVAAGSTTIRATSESVTGTSALTVTAPPPPPPPPPAAPSGLAATVVSTSQVNLSWTDQATTETGYEVERHAGSGTFARVAQLGANVTSWDNTGLTAATTYTYRVRAVNAAGASGYSNTVTATTQSPPPPPPPGTVDTVFYEGFESGSFGAWEDGYNAAKHRIVTNATFARAGTRYLEVTNPAGDEGGWLTHWFMPGYDSVYVSVHIRLDATWRGGTKYIALYGSRTDNQWSAFGRAGQCPNGTDFFAGMIIAEPFVGDPGPTRFYTYHPAMQREPDGVTCWGSLGNGQETYTAPTDLPRGSWHRIEYWLKLNTPGQSNSVQRFWIDGVLRGEWNGLNIRSTNILRINAVQLSFSICCGGAPQTQRMYVDEVLVTRARPSP